MKTRILILILICFIHKNSIAQYGILDPSFGTGGKVITDIAGADDKGTSVAIQSDGKIVVAGFAYNGSNNDVALVRYKTDGIIDSTFGINGKVITPIGNGNDYGLSIAIQPDSNIVVGGYSHNGINNDFALLRFLPDGSIDNSFGTNGIVTTPIGSYGDNANSIVLQPDGKIIAAGYSDTTTGDFFALARYNTDGNLDATFGDAGRVITHIGLSDDQINSVKLQSDGKIVAGGYSYNSNDWDFAVARYNTDGTPDLSFGVNGIVTTDFGNEDNMFYAIAIQSDGKIVGSGWSGNQFAAVRYNTDGDPDLSFGNSGIITANAGVSDDADAIAIQIDGSIIIAGNSSNGTDYDFGLLRMLTDGTPDNTFGTGGAVVTDFGNVNDNCLSLAIQNDNKIIAAGFTNTATGRDFAMARYTAGPVGMAEIKRGEIIMYPNPANDHIRIQFDQIIINGEVSIKNLFGETIYENAISNQSGITVRVSNYPTGVYIVNINEESVYSNKKIIVNK